MPGEPRSVGPEILERQALSEFHWLDIFSATVAVDDTFGPNNFFVGNTVLVITPVGTVHHETPHATWPELETICRRREPIGTPPLCKVRGVGEGGEHQVARRIE